MQNEEHLNKLFNLAREQEVLLNSDEIQGLMNSRSVRTPSDKFKTKRIKAMTISTLIIGIAATIGFFVNTNQKSIRKTPSQIVKTVIEPFKTITPEIEENNKNSISPPDATYSTTPKPNYDDTAKKKKILIERKIIINDEKIVIDKKPETGSKVLFKIEDEQKTKDVETNFMVKKIVIDGSNEPGSENKIASGFEKETFVHLTKEELKKLGIYIKDDVFMYEMEGTRIGSCKAFFGDKTLESYSSTSNMEKLKGNNPLAMFATTVDGEIKNLLSMLHNPTKIEANKIAPTLLPVWVEDETSKAGKPYIAWFEINDILINLLPERIQLNVKSDKNFYSHLLIDKNKISEKTKYVKSLIEVDKNQIIVPDESLMKKLGFVSLHPIVYFRHTSNGNELSIDNKMISMNLNHTDSSAKNINTLYPQFCTYYDSLNHSIDMYTDLRGLNLDKREATQHFDIKKFGMLGLLIKNDDADKIFWYDANDAILNELNPEDKKRIKGYAEANKENLKGIDFNTKLPKEKSFEEVANKSNVNNAAIKTITLAEAQLAKLLISVEDKKIVHKLFVGNKTPAIKIIYDKTGTKSTAPFKLENFDTASYDYPRIITDDLGQYARLTMTGAKHYDLEKINSYNLIPILVKSGEEYTIMDQLTKKARPDIIFWYEPTEKFLKILDNKTAGEIRNDIVALSCNRSKVTFTTDSTCDGKSTLSCNYFEACQNTKSKAISKYSVFPNPAKDNFNLKLDLKEECTVLVYMFALNGAEVKQFQIGKMKRGISQKELSSEGIIPGLYLLRITTDKGDIFNERILIKE